MKWASGISFESDLSTALTDLGRDLTQRLGETPDLLLLFVTPHYDAAATDVPALAASRLSPGLLLGCTATGVIGGGHEVEGRAAVAALGATLPEVTLTPFRLQAGDLPDLDAGPGHWHEALGLDPDPGTLFLLLVDPGGDDAFDPRPLLMGLDFAWPASTTMGGIASVLQENRLFLDDATVEGGCVGVALQGGFQVDSLVAQGCRPIGRTMTVTDADGYHLATLDNRPAVEVLVELYHELDEADQELLQTSLHLGVAVTGLKPQLGRGDFLMRNVLQLDHEKSVIAVGDRLRNGQTVQFHVLDRQTAAEDLDDVLHAYLRQHPQVDPAGALLFNCTGRGKRFFGDPGHDSGRFVERLGDVPLGGFFCGGEIAPVGGSTYLHGFTAAFAVLRPAGD
jgi:small ligand-binding sensory domain FIST